MWCRVVGVVAGGLANLGKFGNVGYVESGWTDFATIWVSAGYANAGYRDGAEAGGDDSGEIVG